MKRLDDRGIALIKVQLLTTIMLGAAFLGAFGTRTEQGISRNAVRAAKARAVAEGGIDHAFRLIEADLADGFDDELGAKGTGGGLVPLGDRPSGADYRFRAFPEGGGPSDGYAVHVVDNFDEETGSNNLSTDQDRRVH
ncbi:MAG: hypothetical protein ACREQY_22950, partial [Candidatus Binatia bacterium]